MTAGFVLFAPVIDYLGFPPIAALLTAIVLILVPTELGVLWWAARRENAGVADLIPYRRSFPGVSGRFWCPLSSSWRFSASGSFRPSSPRSSTDSSAGCPTGTSRRSR